MPDSNSSTTRELLIRDSFAAIGMDGPSVNEKAFAARKLNDVMAELDPEGRWLWTISNTETSLTLVVGQRAYSVATPPTGIANYIQNIETCVIARGTQRIPLEAIQKAESLSTYELETGNGEPYRYYLEVTADPANQKLHFFPAPSAADTIKYTYQRMLYDADNASDVPDVKRSMRLSLEKILTCELAPYFGVPAMERQLLKAERMEAKRTLMSHNSAQSGRSSYRTVAEYF